MRSTVVLVDGMNLAFRAYHGLSQLQTTTGVPTGVVYAGLRLTQDIHKKVGVADIIFCWEGGGGTSETWRKTLVDSTYKANRVVTEASTAVFAQLPKLQEALKVLGYAQIAVQGLEADDLLGILSAHFAEKKFVRNVYIYSGDRDMYQCIGDKVKVLTKKQKGEYKILSASDIEKEYGVSPERWAAYKSLVGDSGDNFHGVPGIGPVRAQALIEGGLRPEVKRYKDLSYHHRQMFACLEEHWDQMHLCYKLAYIPRSPNYSLFPTETRKAIKKLLNFVNDNSSRAMTRREADKRLLQFTRICAELELSSFVASRREFFQGIELVQD